MVCILKDVMKRKAMEIEKSKIESARAGKTGTSAYTPSGVSSININNNRSTTDLDLTPTFSRYLLTQLIPIVLCSNANKVSRGAA